MHVLIFLTRMSFLFKAKASSPTRSHPSDHCLQQIIVPSYNCLSPKVALSWGSSSGSVYPNNYNPKHHEKPNIWGAWSRYTRICLERFTLCLAIHTSPGDNTAPKTSGHNMLNYVSHAIYWTSRHGTRNFGGQGAED